MAGEVLRRAVDDEVGAVLERAEVDRRRHGRIDDDGRGVGGGRFEIRHREVRVRRRLEPDEVGASGGGPVWSNSTTRRPHGASAANVLPVP